MLNDDKIFEAEAEDNFPSLIDNLYNSTKYE